jgi:NAD(P)-dependent dehydrogenase (short-subunit alcohol dehydrogenase family)
MERLKRTLPIKRLAQPEEIANVAVFLARPPAKRVRSPANCCQRKLTSPLPAAERH